MGVIVDRTGQRFGRLIVIGPAEMQVTAGGYRKHCWECRCDCGTVLTLRANSFVSGNTRSCGCLRRELVAALHRTHGLSKSPEHRIWAGILSRCRNPNATDFGWYGGRGISVAEEWLDFQQFLEDMGPRPSPRHSVDRICNEKGYEPDNCRWATPKEQCRNQRTTRWVLYQGRRVSLAEASELSGIPYSALKQRIRKGWDESDLFRPLRLRGRART
jgi:hypothetical protein